MKCNAYIDPETKIALKGDGLETAAKNSDAPRCGYEIGPSDMFCPACGTQTVYSRPMQSESLWKGRTPRKEYWKTVLQIAGLGVLAGIVLSLMQDNKTVYMAGTGLVSCILVPYYALVSIRRLHDLNKSGLWMLGFAIGPLAMVCNGNSEIAGVLNGIGMIYNLLVGIPMGFVRGTKGPNKYGPDPLETK